MLTLPEYKIETNVLILRKWTHFDLKDLYEFGKIDGLGEMAGWHHFNNMKDAKTFLALFQYLNTVFCVYHKKDRKAIGTLDFAEDDKFITKKVLAIGYSLSKDYWGKGIMKEAIEAVYDFFLENDFSTLSATVYKDNLNSIRLLDKLGFEFYENYFDYNVDNKLVEVNKYIKQIK